MACLMSFAILGTTFHGMIIHDRGRLLDWLVIRSSRFFNSASNILWGLWHPCQDDPETCRGGDLNPYTLRYQILSLARLPISPPRRG